MATLTSIYPFISLILPVGWAPAVLDRAWLKFISLVRRRAQRGRARVLSDITFVRGNVPTKKDVEETEEWWEK